MSAMRHLTHTMAVLLQTRRHRGAKQPGSSSQRQQQQHGGMRQSLLEASAAADEFLAAAVTPAAAMLRPLAGALAPCSSVDARQGACRRLLLPGRRLREPWRRQ